MDSNPLASISSETQVFHLIDFFKKKCKHSLAPQMILLSHSHMCLVPYQDISQCCLLSFLLLRKLIWIFGQGKMKAYLLYIFCKVKSRIQGKKDGIPLDQEVQVCAQNNSKSILYSFCRYDLSLAFYFEIWLSFFSFYEPSCALFFNTLGPSCVPIFLYVCIAHVS